MDRIRKTLALVVIVLAATCSPADEKDRGTPFDFSKTADTYADVCRHVERGGKAIVCVNRPAVAVAGYKTHAAAAVKGYADGYHVCYQRGGKEYTAAVPGTPTAADLAALVAPPAAKTVTVTVTTPARHSHKCPHDGTVWTHAEGDPNASHSFPKCGREQREVLYVFPEKTVTTVHPAGVGTAAPAAAEAIDRIPATNLPTQPAAETVRPKRVAIGGRWYDRYADGTLIECAACNRAAPPATNRR
jgi:hypothetical protein